MYPSLQPTHLGVFCRFQQHNTHVRQMQSMTSRTLNYLYCGAATKGKWPDCAADAAGLPDMHTILLELPARISVTVVKRVDKGLEGRPMGDSRPAMRLFAL